MRQLRISAGSYGLGLMIRLRRGRLEARPLYQLAPYSLLHVNSRTASSKASAAPEQACVDGLFKCLRQPAIERGRCRSARASRAKSPTASSRAS